MDDIDRKIHEMLGKCWVGLTDDEWAAHSHITGDGFCKECGECVSVHTNPQYSTDIAAAFEVVGWLENQGWEWSVSFNGNEFAAKYDVRMFLDVRGEPDKRVIEINETIPLAICEAALKAIREMKINEVLG